MARFISESYETFKSRKNKTYTGTVIALFEFDGDIQPRLATDGLQIFKGIGLELPHPAATHPRDALTWLGVNISWDYHYGESPDALCLTLTAQEDRESKLPTAEQIWQRLAFRWHSGNADPREWIAKNLTAEEEAKSTDNLARVLQGRVEKVLADVLGEAREQAKAAVDYDRRLALLDADYAHAFIEARRAAVSDTYEGSDDKEDVLVLSLLGVMHHKHTVGARPMPYRGGQRVSVQEVKTWLYNHDDAGWKALAAQRYAGRKGDPSNGC